jgi:threonine/homoserine/homoserine lactone efflux protein
MGNAIGQILAFAVGIAISPIPIIGVVLMLATPKARTNGPAFLLGWVLGLAIAGTIVLLASGGADADTSGSTGWANVLKLILGIALLVLAARRWRSRPPAGAEAELPRWMQSVDQFSVRRSASLGAALAAVNPKNLILLIGGAAAIAQTGASAGAQAVALIALIAVATIGVGTPVAIYFALGERSKHILDDLKERMSRNNAAIMAVLCLVIGAKLIGDAISAFSA